MTSTLLRATLQLLEQTALEDWKRLAKDCELNIAWIRQLKAGVITEPGINKIERLYKALGGNMADL
jgi:hypothetical protein